MWTLHNKLINRLTKYFLLIILFNFFQYWSNIISNKSKSSGNGECRLFVQDDLTRMALDVLGGWVFSYKFNAIKEGHSMITRSFIDILTGFNVAVKIAKDKIESWFPFTKWLTESSRKREQGFQVIFNVIREVDN